MFRESIPSFPMVFRLKYGRHGIVFQGKKTKQNLGKLPSKAQTSDGNIEREVLIY